MQHITKSVFRNKYDNYICELYIRTLLNFCCARKQNIVDLKMIHKSYCRDETTNYTKDYFI